MMTLPTAPKVLLLLVICTLQGCKLKTSKLVGGDNTTSPSLQLQKLEIEKLNTKIKQATATTPDNPSDALGTLQAFANYATAYAQADVSPCPEDFRRQFYRTRQAWLESTIDLQAELAFSESAESAISKKQKGEESHLDSLTRKATTSMENALQQLEELRAVASRYGVNWE